MKKRIANWLLRLAEWLDPPRRVDPEAPVYNAWGGTLQHVAYVVKQELPVAIWSETCSRVRSDIPLGTVRLVIETGDKR